MAAKKDLKRLTRPKEGRKLAGVCAGIANYFEVDPVVIRVFWIFLLIPGGLPGLIPYILCWIIIPEEK
jgi:phage shock protein PspC (stress-responsive transcriptional regulator)